MYKLTRRIKNISRFRVVDDLIAYKDNRSLKNRSIYLNQVMVNINNVTGFSFYKKSLYFSTWNNEVFNLNDRNKIDKINSYLQVSELSTNSMLVLKNTEYYTVFLNNTKYHIPNIFVSLKSLITNNTIYSNIENTIQAYSIRSGELLWIYQLSKADIVKKIDNVENNYAVLKIIGIYNNEVLVACSNQRLIALDVENGTLKYQWENFKNLSDTQVISASTICFELDKKKGKLVLLFANYQLEIDIKSREVYYYNLEKELKEKKCYFGCSDGMPFTETHFYIKVVFFKEKETKSIFTNGIAILNRKTRTIEWLFTSESFGTGTNVPILQGGKIYQLDLRGNLYIFEKDYDA